MSDGCIYYFKCGLVFKIKICAGNYVLTIISVELVGKSYNQHCFVWTKLKNNDNTENVLIVIVKTTGFNEEEGT